MGHISAFFPFFPVFSPSQPTPLNCPPNRPPPSQPRFQPEKIAKKMGKFGPRNPEKKNLLRFVAFHVRVSFLGGPQNGHKKGLFSRSIFAFFPNFCTPESRISDKKNAHFYPLFSPFFSRFSHFFPPQATPPQTPLLG